MKRELCANRRDPRVPLDTARPSGKIKSLIRFWRVKNLEVNNNDLLNLHFHIPATGELKKTPPAKEAFTNCVKGVFFLKLNFEVDKASDVGEKKTLLVVLKGSNSSTVSRSNMSLLFKEPNLWGIESRRLVGEVNVFKISSFGIFLLPLLRLGNFVKVSGIRRLRPSAGLLTKFCETCTFCLLVSPKTPYATFLSCVIKLPTFARLFHRVMYCYFLCFKMFSIWIEGTPLLSSSVRQNSNFSCSLNKLV